MKQIFILITAILSMIIVSQCGDSATESDQEMRELTVSEKKLVESDNLFGFKVFRKVAEIETGRNMFISPLSISMALGMTLNGAEGVTEQEMEEVLELSGLTQEEINQSYQSLIRLLSNLDPKVKFEIANSIWTRSGFDVKEPFYQNNRKYFDAEVAEVDFSSNSTVDRINGWVGDKTHGKINQIVTPPINPLTMMILINAIYFKGDWTTQFSKDDTRPQTFYQSNGSTIDCDMMNLEDKFKYMENDDIQAIELPYGDGDFSMAVMLPKENDIGTDLDVLIGNLTSEYWGSLGDYYDSVEVDLYLPKFELEFKVVMNDILKTLGMPSAFDPQLSDFSGIADIDDLHISEVLHKTYVKVDEEGTEAAAVTSVTVGTTSLPPDDIIMRVDRPFAFIIKENQSGTILFMGKVENPSE